MSQLELLHQDYKRAPSYTRLSALLAVPGGSELCQEKIWFPRWRSLQTAFEETGVVLWNEDGLFAPTTVDPLREFWPVHKATQLHEHLRYNIYMGVCFACWTAFGTFRLLIDKIPAVTITNPIAALGAPDWGGAQQAVIYSGYTGFGFYGLHTRTECQRNYMCTCGRQVPMTWKDIQAWNNQAIKLCLPCGQDHPLLFNPGKLGSLSQLRLALEKRRKP